jgi:hypothetical protein
MTEKAPVEKPTAAFVLSLLAGLWMLATGTMMSGVGEWVMGGWMWGHGMMRGLAPTLWWPWFGLIAGIVVLIGAAMLYAKPEQRQTWGIVIIMAGVSVEFLCRDGRLGGRSAGRHRRGAGVKQGHGIRSLGGNCASLVRPSRRSG